MLIVGGRGAGKRAVAEHLGFAPGDIVCDVQDLVRVDAGPEALAALADELAGRACVICDEVGCGVVPIDPADRAWREAVGRLCCLLAERADVVVRVCCGIPQAIKGELPRFAGAPADSSAAPSGAAGDGGGR